MKSLLFIILSLVITTAFAAEKTEVTYNLNEVEIIRGRTHADSIDFKIKKLVHLLIYILQLRSLALEIQRLRLIQLKNNLLK